MIRIEYEDDLWRMLCKNENMPMHKAEKYSFVSSVAKEGIHCLQSMLVFMKHGYFHEAWNFSLRSMKRREGVFSPKAQKGMYKKVSCIAKK
jgi:hypothetical protein